MNKYTYSNDICKIIRSESKSNYTGNIIIHIPISKGYVDTLNITAE